MLFLNGNYRSRNPLPRIITVASIGLGDNNFQSRAMAGPRDAAPPPRCDLRFVTLLDAAQSCKVPDLGQGRKAGPHTTQPHTTQPPPPLGIPIKKRMSPRPQTRSHPLFYSFALFNSLIDADGGQAIAQEITSQGFLRVWRSPPSSSAAASNFTANFNPGESNTQSPAVH